jgi:hypothetical protein
MWLILGRLANRKLDEMRWRKVEEAEVRSVEVK